MKRKLASLGLACVAVLAFAGISAAGASALEYKASSYPVYLHGEEKCDEACFLDDRRTVKCNATFKATPEPITGAQTELTIDPTYTNCTAFGQNATVSFGSCDYRFGVPTVTSPTTTTHAQVKIICGTSTVITVTVPTGNCSLTIGEQTPAGRAMMTNEGSGATATVKVASEGTGETEESPSLHNIKYTVNGPGTICGTPGTYTNGRYTGSVVVKGNSATNTGGTQIGVSVG